MASYGWDARVKNYRNLDTGTIVGRDTIAEYRAGLKAASNTRMRALADDAANGLISPADFSIGMRNELRSGYSTQYMLARGGRQQMTNQDWGRVGNMLRGQYGYLDGFVADISNGRYDDSPGGASARASLYASSMTQSYERGVVASYGMPTLPSYPGDGTTICMARCGCTWRIVENGPGDWDVYWELNTALENCPTCQQRAADWYPIEIRNGVIRNTELEGTPVHDAGALNGLLHGISDTHHHNERDLAWMPTG